MAVGGSVIMANSHAEVLFDPAELRTIQEHAKYLMVRKDTAVDQIELTTGKVVRLRSTRVLVGKEVAGAVLEVKLCSEAGAQLTPGSLRRRGHDPQVGNGRHEAASEGSAPARKAQ